MNGDRLRFDLTNLADEVTPVDLRDRALRTSRRLGIQRAVATSAAVVVLLGAATGTAIALVSRSDGQTPMPADSPSITITPSPVDVIPTPSPSVEPAVPVRPPAASDDAVLPANMYWYTEEEFGEARNAPGRIWRATPDGKWKLVREGRPGSKTNSGPVAPSPDGARAAWIERSPTNRLVISRFGGGSVYTVPVKGKLTCGPRWLDSDRLLFAEGQIGRGDWTVVAVNADGTGRRVLATNQQDCPVVGAGWFGRSEARTVELRQESGKHRTVTPRIPAGLKIHSLVGIAAGGQTVVISTHVPNAGECGCTWRIRNYRVDVASGAAVELATLDPAWRKATGHGDAKQVRFLPNGEMVAQIDAASIGGDAPDHRLVRYAADGRVLGSTAVPSGNPWGELLG
ncbi:hypothetical protein V6V47_05680 [Micromonospora sp. CPCC 205539]|uniref:hypothetical protein n=1 Tax=Micromonospora sp. CPCC 205539 TaxID=3122408 RepID=UPI002FF353EC